MKQLTVEGGEIIVDNRGNNSILYVYLLKDNDAKQDIDCIILRRLNPTDRVQKEWAYHTPNHWAIISSNSNLENIIDREKNILALFSELKNLEPIKQLKESYASNQNAAHTIGDVKALAFGCIFGVKGAEDRFYKATDTLAVYERKVGKIINKQLKKR